MAISSDPLNKAELTF